MIHTGKGESANEITFFSLAQFQLKKMSVYLSTKEYQSFNFFAAILENCDLKTSILKSSPLSGQTDGLEIIRYKTPYLYNQGGYNSDSYKGFLILYKLYTIVLTALIKITLIKRDFKALTFAILISQIIFLLILSNFGFARVPPVHVQRDLVCMFWV